MSAKEKKYIAITAAGSVSAYGLGWEETGESCFSCKSFIKPVSFLENEIAPVASINQSAEQALQCLKQERKHYQQLDRSVLLVMLAARQIKPYLQNLFANTKTGLKAGINIGSSRGATETFEKHYDKFLKQKTLQTSVNTSPTTTLGNVSSWVMQDLQIQGFALSHSITCSTAIQAIANAVAWLKADMADIFIAGATEAPLTPFTIAQMRSLRVYSQDIDSAYPCRPLSNESKPGNTMVLGEGAAIFVLEKLSAEQIREKKPLAIIDSVGWGSEAVEGFTSISDEGKCFAEAMKMAIENASNKNSIDAILMHAPGTRKGDKAELNALAEVFSNKIPAVFSNKWHIGHTLGASAALNLYLALHIFQQQKFPAFPYDVTTVKSHPAKLNSILINAAGFGGNAGSLVVSSPEILY
ncbi:MAG: beta-ketoacyl synthase N-terminal-like domain-containing protein [Bacteroidia bacterium]